MANSKLMSSRTYSGTFPSPETPPCGEDDDPSIGIPKGWSSERVPSSSYRSRRYIAAAALMPFSSGRTLPSKWEDAERWICSPVSLGNVSTNSNYCYYGGGPGAGSRTGVHLTHHQRRAKSKSGPLGPIGPEYYGGGYNSFSPVLGVGVINGGRWRNSLTIEPSGLASARFEERLPIEGGGVSEEARRSCPGHDASHWMDSWSGPPSPTQDQIGEVGLTGEHNEVLDNKLEQENDNGEPEVERAISRRDMATQMFPESHSNSTSTISSPKSSISNTSPRPLLHNESKRDVQIPDFEVRDVQVDKQTSTSRSYHDRDNYLNSSTCVEVDNKISKFERKEARINAWENLQKAKAEAAIQKLEEKLEKKRASSMDKIMRKLRRVEIKAEKMRNIISGDDDYTESQAISKTTSKIPSFCRMIRLNSSTKNCATCYPF